jgi:hypothetical protein
VWINQWTQYSGYDNLFMFALSISSKLLLLRFYLWFWHITRPIIILTLGRHTFGSDISSDSFVRASANKSDMACLKQCRPVVTGSVVTKALKTKQITTVTLAVR